MGFNKGHKPWNKGKEWEEMKGENNPLWGGGKVVTYCKFCGKPYMISRCRLETTSYCSRECAGKDRFRGSNHPSWGKKRDDIRGKNNPNWKGGISKDNKSRWSDNDYLHWRRAVFFRDDYTCQECGKRGCYLEAHHIKPWRNFKELRYSINNGITLCKECHIKLDNFRLGEKK